MLQSWLEMKSRSARKRSFPSPSPYKFILLIFALLLTIPLYIRSSNNATLAVNKIHDDAQENQQNATPVLLTSLIFDLDLITPTAWSSLQTLCVHHPTTIAILYKQGDFAASAQKLKHCKTVLFVPQIEAERDLKADKSLTLTDQPKILQDRILRLGYLRSWFKSHLFLMFRDNVSAVVVVDLDILEFPTMDSLTSAISSVSVSVSEAGQVVVDAVCANGYEKWLGLRHYYDTYALVYADESWAFKSLTSITAILFLKQNALYTKLVERDTTMKVTSCFGGLTVYKSSTFFNDQCNYQMLPSTFTPSRAYYDTSNNICEHVVFHTCLNSERGKGEDNFNIVIDGTLTLFRDANIWGGLNNPTLVYSLILGAVVVGVGLFFWNRRVRGKGGGGVGGGEFSSMREAKGGGARRNGNWMRESKDFV